MNASERRIRILEKLASSDEVINATRLAEEFNVTRQIIVSDIALLRANGKPIAAERRGYYIKKKDGIYKAVVCRHSQDDVLKEFNAIVDNGGRVLNVIVEHPLYGQICVDLNIASRYDATEFVEKSKQCNATYLCELTDGLHVHALSVPDEDTFGRICDSLTKLGILVEAERTEQ